MPNHAIDPVSHSLLGREVSRSETEAKTIRDPVRVNAMRSGQYPLERNQRSATLVRQLPLLLAAGAVFIRPILVRSIDFCLPGRSEDHRRLGSALGNARYGKRAD